MQQSGVDELTFIGGEPTLLGDALIAAVASARAAGFRRVGVQTNGRLLAPLAAPAGRRRPHRRPRLAPRRGRLNPRLSHRRHRQLRRPARRRARRARAAGLVIVATTLVTRSSFRTLAPLPSLLRAQGVGGWTLALPLVAGAAAQAFNRVVPRLGLALPFALHALDAARRLELPAWIRGAPRCLGPFAGDTLDEGDAPRAFAPRCDGCPARARAAPASTRATSALRRRRAAARPPPLAVDAATASASCVVSSSVRASSRRSRRPASTAPQPPAAHWPGPACSRRAPRSSPAAPRQPGRRALREHLPRPLRVTCDDAKGES